ncbi:MAG: SusC/RagA family TonB-linked outer membrane protein [Gemmatimonadaceae bacterium]|nr:SusC/RagA family TonB-linked outer membrane protein [Gemmatimonadaceae bacterium]
MQMRVVWFGSLLLALSLSLSRGDMLAQTGTIAGKVTDVATNLPLSDVRVTIPGTALVTLSNSTGDYRLVNVSPGRVTLAIFRLGYRATRDTVRVDAGQTLTHDVKLSASLVTLSELVVTGTAGNQERRAQSAQVASIAADQIVKDAPIKTIGELLQSRSPSVSVNANSGVIGSAKTIRIRGASSINLSNQPLLFVDGVRINEGFINGNVSGQAYDRMNDLSPDEIESIEVVKGPAAATLYGADASAGVIQIITKKGRPGANRFTQTLRVEGGSTDQNYDVPDNYGNCTAALVAPTSRNPLCRGQAVGLLVSDNPLERVGAFRTGQDYTVGWSARGGGQNYGYVLSLGREGATGTLPNSSQDRYNMRTNFNYLPNSRVTIDAGLGLTQNRTSLPNLDNSVFGWIAGGMLGSPLTRTDTPENSADGWFGFNRHKDALAAIDNQMLTYRVLPSLTVNYVPFSSFTNRLTVGADLAADRQAEFFPKNDSARYTPALLNSGQNTQASRTAQRLSVDYLGNVRQTYGAQSQWEANLSFGMQVISTENTTTNSQGVGFVTNANRSITSAATTSGGSFFTEQTQVGYLSQLQVGLNNRTFVQAAVRIDKNSAFGADAQAFVLPKFGATWTVSEEPFFEPLTKLVNSLRVRASWGTTGRSPAPGAALTTLVSAPFNITGTTSAGANPGNPGNADLRPERGTEIEAGLDASFWNDRVSTELTYYNKKTTDLIIAKPIPPSLGFNTNPLANVGEVLNSGLELAVNVTAVELNNFSWTFRAGGNTLHNELTDLGGVAPFSLSRNTNRAIQGEQLGVYVSKRIKSINEATGVVTVSDTLEPVGNLYPTLEWNLSNTVTLFKNLRITASIDAKRDFIVHNFRDYYTETLLIHSNRRLDPNVLSRRERLRRYGNDTPGTPAFVTLTGASATTSDVFEAYLQPGDFVRFRELSASYFIPKRLLSRFGNVAQNASVTFAVKNLKLWTKYEGPDPEVIAENAAFDREDFFSLPQPRRASLRFDFTF